MKFKLEKKELMYALVGASIILLWFLLVKDLISPWLATISPFFAAIIYHVAVWIGIFFLASILASKKLRIKFSLITISILAGIDIIDAPYIISKSGIINTSTDYWFTTYDAAFASIYSLFAHGYFLYLLVYIITPIFLIAILPILIAQPKIILRAFQ